MDEQNRNSNLGINRGTMIRYLLGEMTARGEEQFEDQFFSDPECFTQLIQAEDRLIEDYLFGELSQAQRKSFESYFLSSLRLRQKVEFTRSLNQVLSTSSEPKAAKKTSATAGAAPFYSLKKWIADWRLALTVTAALLALIALISIYRITRPVEMPTQVSSSKTGAASPNQSQEVQGARLGTSQSMIKEDNQHDEGRAPSSTKLANDPSRDSSTVTLVLNPGRLRGPSETSDRSERSEILSIPPSVRYLLLRLKIEPASKSGLIHYNVRIVTPEGNLVKLPEQFRPHPSRGGDFITLNIPARLLSRGDYVLTLLAGNGLNESEELADYYFTVLSN